MNSNIDCMKTLVFIINISSRFNIQKQQTVKGANGGINVLMDGRSD